MRLLFVTQVVDKNDSMLGFTHGWLEEFAKHFEQITVICLQEGEHSLPPNIKVYSLGKEKGISRLGYVIRFFKYVWRFRREYDAVLIHMNQEYAVLGGPLWKLLGKPIYMWRNHYVGNWITDAAAAFCTKVFCTSRTSYTAKYKQTVLMPVGVNTNMFKPVAGVGRLSHSILFLSRMSTSKRPELLLDALRILTKKGIEYQTSFVGSPPKGGESYYKKLQEGAKSLNVEFTPSVPNRDTPRIYNAHQIFVNTSPSGMYDKTIFEAAACGCVVIAASEDWRALAGEEYSFDGSVDSLVQKLETALLSDAAVQVMNPLLRRHSLSALAGRLADEMAQ